MAGQGEVTIIVAAEDQTGAVMDAVSSNLQRVQARSESAGRSMAAAGHAAVPPWLAASATVRVLDGDFSRLMRVEERFLSMIPGLSKVMSALFLPIGAFAVTEGLMRMGQEAYEATQKVEHMADTIRTDFGDSNLTFEKQNDTLRVTNDRLEDAIMKLQGKPRNGLAEALDEARVRADDLALSLIRDNDQIAEMMKKNSVGFFGQLLNKASTKDAEKLQNDYRANARKIAFEGQQAENAAKTADEAKAARLATQNRLYALQSATLSQINQQLSDDAKPDVAQSLQTANLSGPYGSQPIAKDDSALVNDLQGLYTAISEQRDMIGLTGKNDDLQNQQKALQTQHDLMEARRVAAREAAEERRKESEWLDRIQKQGIGPSQQATWARQAQAEKALQESNRDLVASEDYTAERTGKAWTASAEAAVKASQKQIQAMREVQDARIRDAGTDYQKAQRDTEFGVRTGSMTESQRTSRLRAAAQQEYEIRANALQMLATLDAINPDDPEKVQRDLDQIAALHQQYSEQMVELTQQQYEQQQAAAKGYVGSIIDPLITGTATVEQRFKRMADNIIGDLERIAERKATEEIADALLGGKGSPAHSGAQGASRISAGGMGSAVMGIMSTLFGRKKKGDVVASNGSLATGAGTVADSITGSLAQGKGSGGSGVVVQVINQGTPQQAVSSGSSGGGGQEQQIISVLMKDADTLGPITKAFGGALNMLGSL